MNTFQKDKYLNMKKDVRHKFTISSSEGKRTQKFVRLSTGNNLESNKDAKKKKKEGDDDDGDDDLDVEDDRMNAAEAINSSNKLPARELITSYISK